MVKMRRGRCSGGLLPMGFSPHLYAAASGDERFQSLPPPHIIAPTLAHTCRRLPRSPRGASHRSGP